MQFRILLVCVLMLLTIPSLTIAQNSVGPKLSKDTIPKDISPELKTLIEQLYSSSAEQRAKAARALGERGKQSVPAVPFLLTMLDDIEDYRVEINTAGFHIIGRSDPSMHVATALEEINDTQAIGPLMDLLENPRTSGKAQRILEKLTGQKFGKDKTKWQEWWQKNKVHE